MKCHKCHLLDELKTEKGITAKLSMKTQRNSQSCYRSKI